LQDEDTEADAEEELEEQDGAVSDVGPSAEELIAALLPGAASRRPGQVRARGARDSFYHLMRGLEERAAASPQRGQRDGVGGGRSDIDGGRTSGGDTASVRSGIGASRAATPRTGRTLGLGSAAAAALAGSDDDTS
jgi:hypothetical protein